MSQLSPSENSILYIVRCTFSADAEPVAERWLTWLCERHLAEVLAAGAISAEVYRSQGMVASYEVHYRFASEQDYVRYERLEAPRLRNDGLERFPLALGLQYERRVGQQLFALDSSDCSRAKEPSSQSDD